MKAPSPRQCVEWFVAANLGFLGVDIWLAHGANRFRDPVEWLPVAFSPVAVLLLALGLSGAAPRAITRALDIAVAVAAIAIGVAGLVFHLSSAFFVDRTLRSLVYSAPFAAPAAYVGVGLLLLLLRLEPAASRAIGPWTLFLALGGFVGNLLLSLLDHAQNAFFDRLEWVPVIAAAFACSFLVVALLGGERAMLRGCLAVCAIEAVVGVLGFVLHLVADVRRPAASLSDHFLFGAPPFAPLLFTDLAVLAALALWAMLADAAIARRPL
jgi:hypothetical protein